MTRCAALKNPCAIRRGCSWLGLSKVQHDREFCEFEDNVFGIRAFLVLMRTYHYKYHCNTIKEIISRYAPITENNTYAYIAFVTKHIRECAIVFYNTHDLPLSSSFDFINENMVVNVWYNRTSPPFWLFDFCSAVCELESKFVLDRDLFFSATKLL